MNEAVTAPGPEERTTPVVQLGPSTLRALATRGDVLDAVDEVLGRLVPDSLVAAERSFLASGRARFGEAWGYLDVLTVLMAAARVLRPRRYLEIGVLRGRSLAMVASAAPDCALVGFDLWVEGYAGFTGGDGPAVVAEQLRRVGHRGEVALVAGPSHRTVPQYLAEHPDEELDLVTVDGDHSEEGARRDLDAVLPRVAVGGVVVFDDVAHPAHPWLARVWEEALARHPELRGTTYTEVGNGIAFAVRHAPSAAAAAERAAAATIGIDPGLAVTVTDVRSRHAAEPIPEGWQVWLPSGAGGLEFTLDVAVPASVRLVAIVAPGPARSDPTRTLEVSAGTLRQRIRVSAPTRIDVPVVLERGANRVRLAVVERGDVALPAGALDERELMLLVSQLAVRAHEGPVPGARQRAAGRPSGTRPRRP